MTRATPFAGTLTVDRRDADGAVTTAVVDPGEPLLAGHYPGFAILPGVCLVECAHRSVLAVDERLELAAIDATRFLAPVRPGDDVTTDVRRDADGERWSAVLSTAAGKVAEVRLRYREIS